MEKPYLLIVDDEEVIRDQLKWALYDEYTTILAEGRESALEQVKANKPPLILLDLGLPPSPRSAEEGLKALEEILSEDRDAKVIVVTGNQERTNALKAIEKGAFDYFTKPPDMEEVRVVLKRALHILSLEKENAELKKLAHREPFEEILGESSAMQEIFKTIRKVATTDVSALIAGESGTGKELVAKAVHRLSNRARGPFIAINCGAIPENLLESELFGHEKGAFTGAHAQVKGKFEYAHGGTLFLDEIGELPQTLQVKLLRFLQEHSIERVGGRQPIPVNVRILAATNRDLTGDIKAGRFREDLYYRVGVVTLSIPPLRDRGNDLILLAKSFLQKFSAEYRKPFKGFHTEALAAIESHPWPGNVRELENRVKRAVIISEGKSITPSDLELEAPSGVAKLKTLKEIREGAEEDHARKALEKHNWNISKASMELGVSRPTFHELIKKYNILRDH